MFALLTAMMAVSCSDDESWVAPFRTDFADLATGSDGAIISMQFDNGTKYESAYLKSKISNFN